MYRNPSKYLGQGLIVPARRFPVSGGASNGLLNNLASYWKLDEASGNALDAHGSNPGTDNGTVGAASGKINGARDFVSGNSEYFNCGAVSGLDAVSKASFAFWCRRTNVTTHTIAVGTGGSTSRRFNILIYTDGKAYIQACNGNPNDWGSASHGQANNIWAFFGAVFDGTQTGNANRLKLYVNGLPATIAFNTGGGGAVIPATLPTNANQGVWKIGREVTAFSTGQIDEVSLWPGRALSDADMANLYNGGSGLSYSSFTA